MQTSSLTPVTLYTSDAQDAPALLPLLPEGSAAVHRLDEIGDKRRVVLVTHDASSARAASQWVATQPTHRQGQCILMLPPGESRLNPSCSHRHRPMPLRDLLQFLSSGHMLPELPASIRLTEIESALLEHLYNADTPLEHETLMRRIWGHTQELDTHTLETHLYRLRKKLEGSGWQIVTENGHYHLLSSTN